MKLSVKTRKGVQSFRRAGLDFSGNETIVNVEKDVADKLLGEAMLQVKILEEGKEVVEEAPQETVEQEEIVDVSKYKVAGPFYVLPDGSKVRGRKAAEEALAKL